MVIQTHYLYIAVVLNYKTKKKFLYIPLLLIGNKTKFMKYFSILLNGNINKFIIQRYIVNVNTNTFIIYCNIAKW